jgi:hypothetical protein
MKSIFLLVLFLFSLHSFSQTSTEEYNYVTKGLKIQMESGLDMKKGYVLEAMDTILKAKMTDWYDGAYHREKQPTDYGKAYIFKKLYKLDSENNKKFVCYVVSIDSYKEEYSDLNSIYPTYKIKPEYNFFCIPSSKSDEEIKTLFFNSLIEIKEYDASGLNSELAAIVIHFLYQNLKEQ